MKSIVGIGEYAISHNKENSLKTFALASCVAVTAYSPIRKKGAMIHIALPEPDTETDRMVRPGYYATTGIPLMIEKLCSDHGCTKGELEIQIFGGAESIRKNDIFNIGKRNIEAVVETLYNLNLRISGAQVGGKVSRTIELDINTGKVDILTQPIGI
ncbi:MAG: cheD1 [Eubacterium sp.]|nr:cheD1 [Eubacterium sp.]